MPWDSGQHDAIVKTLAVVCEVTGTQHSSAAQDLILRQLGNYPAKAVLLALEKCAIECRFKLTLADIVTRLVDGRPGAEEAWAAFPKREEDAGVVTEEMSVAWGVAASLYASDQIACRMAFKEAYQREVQQARTSGAPVKWRVSPGFDKAATEGAAIEALRLGKVTEREALQYVPPEHHDRALSAAGRPQKALPAPASDGLARVRQLTGNLTKHWQERAEKDPPETEP